MNGSPPGASLRADYLCRADEADLLAAIDAAPWSTALRRRVQQFGCRYDYRSRDLGPETRLVPLPDWLAAVCNRLVADGVFGAAPDQVIANEYLPGQGVSAHIDRLSCFGPVVASLSLGGAATMLFSRDGAAPVATLLPPRSLLVLSGEARTQWKHAIPARKSDSVGGVRIPRTRRVSLTFRTVRSVA